MQKPFLRPSRILQVGGSTLALAAFLLTGQAYDTHAAAAPQHAKKHTTHTKTAQACTSTTQTKSQTVTFSEQDMRSQLNQYSAYPAKINISAGSVVNFVNKTNEVHTL